ncbi:hypothetical protein SAMN04488540_10956 [Ferrimonas sediminum]|uniref:Nephrocystin 3-like N-terminal domain-containing protein n=1 Tax=Ferrimonas sediminum TaxID=718193 RepID=A0A1G8UG05_9GAMM|nr:hypothetical protein [Ferrimonas sediminum]SDJ51910.1 hypothetical protein SAMN04488540_10956 [Ferrimonas sediminum]
MNAPIKSTQLTRLGYEYQDLICIKILVDWYHNRDKYRWVKVESSSLPDTEISSLDDVIALRSDGKYELTQVKFTIDAEREDLSLCFDWLTKRKGKGTSLIQKWCNDLIQAAKDDRIGKAELITNRKPDQELLSCLIDGKIDPALIPAEHFNKIESQLGGKSNVEMFFRYFDFIHSQPTIDDLENKLHDSLVPDHTNEEGWHRFLAKVMRWATREGEPNSDGQITFTDLHELLSHGIIRDISQYFIIPEKYSPPTISFHDSVLNKLDEGGAWVVSGAPGMGKSTYLSYLYECLQSKNYSLARHHYSLSTQSLIDRISFSTSATSIIKQIKASKFNSCEGLKEEPEYLDEWLTSVGRDAKRFGEKFILILDGLDHVWRERSDISQLEHLINKILPAPEGVTIIFGTQPVSSSKLPDRLLYNCPVEGERWLNIPYMDLSSIGSWLEGLRNSGVVDIDDNYSSNSISELAVALRKISSGYPLHLIYSFRALIAKKINISVYDIEKLDRCPDGDINAYYWSIWSNLTEQAKEILFLMSVTEFPWPNKNAFSNCFSNPSIVLDAYKEIEHLVENRRSGVFPFHNSLLVNIQQRDEFEEVKERLYPFICNWLSTYSPPFWRWAWSWIVQAEMGNVDPIIKGVTKEWVIDSLCEGYPLEHIEHIISYAEKVAFAQKNYSTLVDIRLLKLRFLNGPEYQIQDFAGFTRTAMKNSNDESGLLWKSDNIRELGVDDIVVVASLCRKKYPEVIEECYQELYKRALFYANIYVGTDNRFESTVNALIKVLCDTDAPDIERVVELISRVTPKDGLYEKLFSNLLSCDNAEFIFDVDYHNLPEYTRREFLEYAIIASCISGVDIINENFWLEMLSSSFGVCFKLINDNLRGNQEFVGPIYFIQGAISTSKLEEFFFHTLNEHLLNDVLVLEKDRLLEDIENDYDFSIWYGFYLAAVELAKKIKLQEKFNPLDLYSIIDAAGCKIHDGYDYKLRDKTSTVLHVIPDISLKLSLLLKESNLCDFINSDSLNSAQNYSWWKPLIFFEKSIKYSFIPAELDDIDEYWCNYLKEILKRRSDTLELCNEVADILSFCSQLKLERAVELGLSTACRYILGYGYRKDITLHEVFEAIQACSDANIGEVSDYLKRVSCFVVDMFSFTEREIRHIPSWYMSLLSKNLPRRILDEFSFHLDQHNWYVLEDILTSYIKYGDVGIKGAKELISCFYSHDIIETVKERSEEDASLDIVYRELTEYFGEEPPGPRDRASSNSLDSKPVDIPFGSFIPEYLSDLVHVLRNKNRYSDGNYLSGWVEFWCSKGQSSRIIKSYEEYFKNPEEHPYLYGLNESLNSVYEVSKKQQGKRRAYAWAVKSIRANDYWSRYSGSKAEEKICYYAREYSNRWEELLSDTTHGGSVRLKGDEERIIPTSKLVMYLIAAGQENLAVDITNVLVTGLERDIEHLPIRGSYWIENEKPVEVWAFSFALKYYQWPDKAIKKKTALTIAGMIDSDDDGHYKIEFLNFISSLPNEIAVVEYLSILQLNKSNPFSSAEISSVVPYHSLALKYLYDDLGFKYDVKNLNGAYLASPNLTGTSERLTKSLNGLPSIISTRLEQLGEEIGADLLAHMSEELEYVNRRKTYRYFDHYAYCSDVFGLRQRISCSFSSTTETALLSAYIRTVLYVTSNFSVSKACENDLVKLVLPFCKTLKFVRPSMKPDFWPKKDIIKQNGKTPSAWLLQRLLDNIARDDNVILGASGPLVQDPDGVNVDLDLYAVSVNDGCTLNAEEKFNVIESTLYPELFGIRTLSEPIHPKFYGRFETDTALRGVYAPEFNFGLGSSEVVETSKELIFTDSGVDVAKWCYWYQDWYPVRHYDLKPALGVVTIASQRTKELIENDDSNCFLIGKFKIIKKIGFGSDAAMPEIYHFESELKPGTLAKLTERYTAPSVVEYMKKHTKGNRLPRGKRFEKFI